MDSDAGEENPSITKFLTLPTTSARVSNKKQDPIVEFTKSIMLTSDAYIQVAEELKTRSEEAAKEKEKRRIEREDTKRRKVEEKEERTLAWKQKAAHRAVEKARKTLQWETAQRLHRQRAAEKAASKRQGKGRKNPGGLHPHEGEGMPTASSANVAAPGQSIMMSIAYPTFNADWAGTFVQQRPCVAPGAFFPYAMSSPGSQQLPFMPTYGMMSAVPMSFP
jgi:hypothetical protein